MGRCAPYSSLFPQRRCRSPGKTTMSAIAFGGEGGEEGGERAIQFSFGEAHGEGGGPV